ncbi:MAG TPA: hypothetical protein VMS43_12310 [Allosphingosinicella sp.]|nr:hypothetical protein [Allosphingosinicella sp.]
MSLLALIALLAAAQTQPGPVGGLDPRMVQTSEIDSAIGEFDRLCLASPFDRASYEAAIRASHWRFRPAGGAPEGASAYESRRGYAFFRDATPAGRSLPQCNLDTATGRPHARDLLVARIEARLARRLGSVPPRLGANGSLFWQWPAEAGKVARLYLMRRPSDDPRQITLTLQKWPADLAGVGATPREAPE